MSKNHVKVISFHSESSSNLAVFCLLTEYLVGLEWSTLSNLVEDDNGQPGWSYMIYHLHMWLSTSAL